MTDVEYAVMSDFCSVRIMESLLGDIASGRNAHIQADEMKQVRSVLASWRDRMFTSVEPSTRSLKSYYIQHDDDCPKAGLRGCDVGEHYEVIHDAVCECGLDALLKR